MAFSIEINATALAINYFMVPNVTNANQLCAENDPAKRIWQMEVGIYQFHAGEGIAPFSFEITSNGVVSYEDSLSTFVEGKGSPKLIVKGLPIQVDPLHLQTSIGYFKLLNQTGLHITSKVHTMNLLPGQYRVSLYSNEITDAAFEVTSNGSIQYDDTLDIDRNPGDVRPPGFLRGRGSNSLELRGYAITLDATSIAKAIGGIRVDLQVHFLDTKAAHTIHLLPAKYYLMIRSDENIASFKVLIDGTLQYDQALDIHPVPSTMPRGFLSGQGTNTLIIKGYEVTLDATSLARAIGGFRVNHLTHVMETKAPNVVYLLPTRYPIIIHSDDPIAFFDVLLDGTIEYNDELDTFRKRGDTRLPGFLSGKGSNTLVIKGYAVTLDATPLAAAIASFKVYDLIHPMDTKVAQEVYLLPTRYSLIIQDMEPIAQFNILNGGTIEYEDALDITGVNGLPGFLTGKGTNKLTLQGYPVTIDVTSMAQSASSFKLGNLQSHLTTSTSHTVHLLPTHYALIFIDQGIEIGSFIVAMGGKLSYQPSQDIAQGGSFQGLGQTTLTVLSNPMKDVLLPSIWLRLEPNSIQPSLQGGLQAAIHDPLWMIGRQWQLGEFQGEDSGSPVHTQLEMTCSELTRSSLNPAERLMHFPLETLVEQESVRIDDKFQPRLAAEAGLHFLRLLTAQGENITLRNRVIQAFPLQTTSQSQIDKNDSPTTGFMRVMAGRTPDGHSIYHSYHTNNDAWKNFLQGLNANDRSLIENTIKIWATSWYEQLFNEPNKNQPAWVPERLEYRFSVAAPDKNSEIVLTTPEYLGGHLDWYSFNYDPQPAKSLGAHQDKDATKIIKHTAIPSSISYRGMPASRYWEFEDARVDFGAMTAGRQQLAKLLLIDFALVTGDDWFIIPVMVSVGALCNTQLLTVKDTFGNTFSIPSVYQCDSESSIPQGKNLPWSLFQLSTDTTTITPEKFNLFVPPVLGSSLQSPMLEELLMLRDEMANVGWGVERLIEGPLGQAINRSEAYFRSRPVAKPVSLLANEGATNLRPMVYQLESEVPDHWISLQPIPMQQNSAAMMLQPHGDWQGRILQKDTNNKPVAIHEEEVPREGAYITRAFQYARWINGETYLWIGRRKGVGRGEGSSGLQFDRLKPPQV